VQSAGTYISGTNLGNNSTGSTTINGVLFKPTQISRSFENNANTPGTFRYVSGGATTGLYPVPGVRMLRNLPTLLDSNRLRERLGFRAVVGLNPANTYRLQIFAADNRNGKQPCYVV